MKGMLGGIRADVCVIWLQFLQPVLLLIIDQTTLHWVETSLICCAKHGLKKHTVKFFSCLAS